MDCFYFTTLSLSPRIKIDQFSSFRLHELFCKTSLTLTSLTSSTAHTSVHITISLPKKSPNEVFIALMKIMQSGERKIKKRNFYKINVLTYRFPMPSSVDVIFKNGSRFQNTYSHLKSCYGRGKSHAEMGHIAQSLYQQYLRKAKVFGGNITSHLESQTLYDYERTPYNYLGVANNPSRIDLKTWSIEKW